MSFFQDVIKIAANEDLPRLVHYITEKAKNFIADKGASYERAKYQSKTQDLLENNEVLGERVPKPRKRDLIPFLKKLGGLKSAEDRKYFMGHNSSPHKSGAAFIVFLEQTATDDERREQLKQIKKQIHQLEVAKDELIADALSDMVDEEIERVLKYFQNWR